MKLVNINKVAGVELRLGENNLMQVEYVQLEKKGGKIEVKERISNIADLNELKQLSPEIPLAVVLTGKGILHKIADKHPEDKTDALSQLMPGADTANLLWQVFKSGDKYIVSIVRKNIVQDLLMQMGNLGLNIIDFQLGFQPITCVLPMLDRIPETLFAGNYVLESEQDVIIKYKSTTENDTASYAISGYTIKRSELLAFSVGIQYLLGIKHSLFNDTEVKEVKNNYLQEWLFKRVGVGMLGFSFIGLLINFFLFSDYNEKNQVLSTRLAYHKNQFQTLDSLKKAYETRQGFLNQHNLLKSSKVSFYADELGQIQPDAVQLQELNISPLAGKDKYEQEKNLNFDAKIIRIKGASHGSAALNEYIRKCEQLNWVNKVLVLPYSEKEGGISEFELEIAVKN